MTLQEHKEIAKDLVFIDLGNSVEWNVMVERSGYNQEEMDVILDKIEGRVKRILSEQLALIVDLIPEKMKIENYTRKEINFIAGFSYCREMLLKRLGR